MPLTISLPPATEEKLRARAIAAGEDLSSYVAKLVAQFAEPPLSPEELSGPIHQEFLKSGMTDDELGDALEDAKHQMRAERKYGSA